MSATFLIAALASAALAPAAPAHRVYGSWTSCALGGGGYLQQTAWAPSDTRRIYMTSDVGGVFRSDDGGKTWHMLHGALPHGEGSCMVRGVAVHPANPDCAVFAVGGTWGSQRRGLYRTDDAGRTMKLVHPCMFGGNDRTRAEGAVLIADPKSPDTLFAAPIGEGPLKSDDFGLTWRPMGLSGVFPSALVRDRSHPSRMWLVAAARAANEQPKTPKPFEGGLFATEDGKAWTKLSEEAPIEFVQDGSDAGVLHGVFAKSPRVRWSQDGGRSWQVYDNPEGFFPETDGNARKDGIYRAIAASERFTLLAGYGANFYVLPAGSRTWKKLPAATFNEGNWYPAGDAKRSNVPGSALGFVAIEPGHPDHWLFTDWYACYLSPDAGKTWNLSIDGIEMTVFHTLAQDPSRPNRMHAGMADIGYFRSDDGGLSLGSWGSKRGISNNVKSISVCRASPDTVYATAPQGWKWTANQLFRSEDGADSWKRMRMKGLPSLAEKGGERINTVVVRPERPKEVYVAVSGAVANGKGGVWKSTDGGESFAWDSEGMSGAKFFRFDIWTKGAELAVSPDGSMVAVSHDTGRAYARPAGAAAWKEVNLPGAQSYALAADVLSPGRFFVTRREKGVFRSDDGGLSWRQVSSDYANNLATDAAVRGRVAFFTGTEVRLSSDGGDTWRTIHCDVPFRDARNVIAFGGERLYMGTGGNGLFSTTITGEEK